MSLLQEFFNHPKHQGLVIPSKRVASRHNRSCGDECTMCIGEDPFKIGYISEGCAVHMASSEIAAEVCGELDILQALKLVRLVISGFDSDSHTNDPRIEALYELRSYPVRRKCALLAWQTLCDVLEQECNETAGQ